MRFDELLKEVERLPSHNSGGGGALFHGSTCWIFKKNGTTRFTRTLNSGRRLCRSTQSVHIMVLLLFNDMGRATASSDSVVRIVLKLLPALLALSLKNRVGIGMLRSRFWKWPK